MNESKLILSECREAMAKMSANSVDAIVTDAPYGLAFMGADFDTFHAEGKSDNLAFQESMAPIFAEALRVAKPGAHLLAFGGTRTYHRLACAIEDAGWEIRDCIMWVYGSGFPKSLDVAKAIDKSKGLKGEKIGERRFGKTSTGQASGWHVNHVAVTGKQDVFALATDEAKQWNGWGTQTKPAVEPVIIAVKPYDGDIEKAINHLKSMEDKLCSSNVKDAGRSLRPSQAVSSGVKADSAPASVPTPQGEEKERLTTTGKVDDTASAADTSALAQETESIVLNTILLWRRTLEDAYALTNRFTTSMVSSLTIDLKTWSCFLLQTTLVDIVDLVTHQSRLNASALLAENYFFAISAKLNSIRTLTVAGNAISQNEISPHLRPIVVARKPLEGTVAANVLKYGTGAINIDACRVPTETGEDLNGGAYRCKENHGRDDGWGMKQGGGGTYKQPLGRFPANLIHDGSDEVLALFPDSKGALAPVYGKQGNQKCHTGDNGIYGHYEQRDTPMFPRNDSGSAARFFYCAKASRSERNKNCERLLQWEQNQELTQLLERSSQLLKDISESMMQALDALVCNMTSFGNNTTVQFQAECKSTISTATKLITALKTSLSSPLSTTSDAILDAIKTSEESGINLVQLAEKLNQLKLDSTNGEMATAINAVNALFAVLSEIRGRAKQGNHHVTIKPLALMRYLVRLVTRKGGIVLDPFMGSGTTGVAAIQEGMNFIGIERDPHYYEIATRRVNGARQASPKISQQELEL